MKLFRKVALFVAVLVLGYLVDGENLESSSYDSKAGSKALAVKSSERPSNRNSASVLSYIDSLTEGKSISSKEHLPYTINVFTKSKSGRDAPLGAPINTGSSNYYRETPLASYPSQTYYPTLPYDDNCFCEDDKKKKKKVAAAIAIPLALVLGPLAFIGLLTLYSIRTIIVIQIIQSLCTNPTFFDSFQNLCTLINNIGKRSNAKEEIFHKIMSSENFPKLMSFIQTATYTALDNLNAVSELNNAESTP